MILKKRLIVDDSNNPTAVLINDEGEEYPVFLDSLHNTVLFPMLMESGYKLRSLPYGFTKDGQAFGDLPVEKYTPTDVELEQMYNAIGVKLPFDEIKSHVEIDVTAEDNTPPTKYTIFTRDELIKYLEATEVANLDEDFLPLNYFVAPEARFTLQEYKSADNHRWISAISNRRVMSLQKFHNLVAWLQAQHLLGANYSALDVIDAYFSWGFDGLQFQIVAKHRESRPYRLSPNKNAMAMAIRKTQGFIDGAGNMLTPQNEKDVVWKLGSSDPGYINEVTNGLGVNDTRVVTYQCNTKQDITIIEGVQYNITYSTDMLLMQQQTYPPLRVKSPTDISDYLSLTMALPTHMEELYTNVTLRALARMLYDKRRPTIVTSSYDALTAVGAGPLSAIDYILTKYDLTKVRDGETTKAKSEDEAQEIPTQIIEAYLDGESVSDYAASFIEDIVAGNFSIDNIGAGKDLEANVNLDSVYSALYAVHNVMGISLQDIYDQIRQIQPNDKTIVFSNGTYRHVMEVSQLKYSVNGYLRDVQNYDIQCADECNFFTYVRMIAREVGNDNCRRHVGIEFDMVNRSKKRVRELLDQIVAMYEEKVYNTIPDVVKQTQALRMKNVFALSRYFEIAYKGTITWSKALGGQSIVATAEQRETAIAYLEHKIESTVAYCNFTVNSFSAQTLSFNAYCANAYITPQYVIPRSPTATIPELPFWTAWMDLRSSHPDVFTQLVQLGVLPADFVCWSNRYALDQFVERSYQPGQPRDSLLDYFDSSVQEINQWPVNEVFTNATHPIEYLYPGLYSNDKEPEFCADRVGAPPVRFGLRRDITLEDYRDKLYPTETRDIPDQYIKEFTGFNAEILMLVGDSVFKKLPAESGKPITVLSSAQKLYVPGVSNEPMAFQRLTELNPTEYPIVNICGRFFILRSADGRLWEARI